MKLLKRLSVLTCTALVLSNNLFANNCLRDGQRTNSPWDCCSREAQATYNPKETGYNGLVCSLTKKICATIDEEPTDLVPCCDGLKNTKFYVRVNEFNDSIEKTKCAPN